MRINEKGQFAGTALPNIDGLNLQNILERESGEGSSQFMNENGCDNTGVQMLKRNLERG